DLSLRVWLGCRLRRRRGRSASRLRSGFGAWDTADHSDTAEVGLRQRSAYLVQHHAFKRILEFEFGKIVRALWIAHAQRRHGESLQIYLAVAAIAEGFENKAEKIRCR